MYIYITLNHAINKKTTRSKRGISNNTSPPASKSFILQELLNLEISFKFKLDWFTLRKYDFKIKIFIYILAPSIQMPLLIIPVTYSLI